jgi:hypothetical protein
MIGSMISNNMKRTTKPVPVIIHNLYSQMVQLLGVRSGKVQANQFEKQDERRHITNLNDISNKKM